MCFSVIKLVGTDSRHLVVQRYFLEINNVQQRGALSHLKITKALRTYKRLKELLLIRSRESKAKDQNLSLDTLNNIHASTLVKHSK